MSGTRIITRTGRRARRRHFYSRVRKGSLVSVALSAEALRGMSTEEILAALRGGAA